MVRKRVSIPDLFMKFVDKMTSCQLKTSADLSIYQPRTQGLISDSLTTPLNPNPNPKGSLGNTILCNHDV